MRSPHLRCALIALTACLKASVLLAQCEADHTVYLTNFEFTPAELTISEGESVAFVNAQGFHSVSGLNPSNPTPFFLEATEGNIAGVCMGIVTFDQAGTYLYQSGEVPIGMDMTGTIEVATSAMTLGDLMDNAFGTGVLQSASSAAYAFNIYFDDLMNGSEPFTVFAPTDAAVETLIGSLGVSAFDVLVFPDIVAALGYHIVAGVYTSDLLTEGLELLTLQGQTLTFGADSVIGEVGSASIVGPDITATNGVVHIIDATLAPSGYPSANVFDYIANSAEHGFFEQAILSIGWEDELQTPSIALTGNEVTSAPYTVFAPTDAAMLEFALDNGLGGIEGLMSSQYLDDFVFRHIAQGDIVLDVDGALPSATALDGFALTVEANQGTILVNGASLESPNQLAYNGRVHVMGAALPLDLPAVSGTCGTWQLLLGNYAPNELGWDGATVDIVINGETFLSETLNNTNLASFTFPVDEGDNLDFIYNGNSGSHYYQLYNTEGDMVASSLTIDDDIPTANLYGVKACGEPSSCGFIEITFFDSSQDGLFLSSLSVTSEEGQEALIYFDNYLGGTIRQSRVLVPAGPLDFVFSPGFNPAYLGYSVRAPNGATIADENQPLTVPGNVFGAVACGGPISVGQHHLSTKLRATWDASASAIYVQHLRDGEAWHGQITALSGQVVADLRPSTSNVRSIEPLKAGVYLLQVWTNQSRRHTTKLLVK